MRCYVLPTGERAGTESDRSECWRVPIFLLWRLTFSRSSKAQFKLQKQAARAHSVAQYYGWRLDNEFDDEVAAKLETNRSRLQEDASKLDAKLLQLGHQLLPDLRKRHAEVKAHLKAEKEHQAAVAASDQNELTAIHAAIEDQM